MILRNADRYSNLGGELKFLLCIKQSCGTLNAKSPGGALTINLGISCRLLSRVLVCGVDSIFYLFA